MQADQTVISLRPEGGGGGALRGTRFLTPRFDSSSSSFSSDSQTLRSHGGLASTLKVPSSKISPDLTRSCRIW
uniref:Uncharacterized protein n=1 Tax=Fagus sylvatica TaxID=28930 RepID=A0A2N9IUV7_FAGSY